jgi:threonine/homoserine/homoserine lactone efflux protein
VALADATYAAIAAFGLTAVTSVLVGGRMVLGIVGGLVLIWLGYRTFVARPSTAAADAARPGLAAALASIYALTMTNPMTILSFAAVFAALGLSGGSVVDAATLTFGVLVGSALWWVVLTTVVGHLRARVTPTALTWVNRASGALIVAFGVVAILGAISG